MTEPQEQHPGWSARVRLDPVQAKAQGTDYVNAMAFVARELALAMWVDDERNTVWHPGPLITMDVDVTGEYGNGHTTDLVCMVPAALRPDGVPAEVLDHVHGPECEHVMEPFLAGHCCQVCGNQYTRWRLCVHLCVATWYAVEKWMGFYAGPKGG